MSDATRAELLAFTPDVYLAAGYVGPDGSILPSLRGEDATAAATQFMAAEASPQEVSFTFEAIRLLLPEHAELAPRERLDAAIGEALQVVARAIQQPNNEGIPKWLNSCAAAVSSEADLAAFVEHFQAVTRQYAVLVALPSLSSPSLQP